MPASLFNTLTAHVVADHTGTHTELRMPSGKLFLDIPAQNTQPRFGKQQYIYIGGQHYALVWRMTPQTPTMH